MRVLAVAAFAAFTSFATPSAGQDVLAAAAAARDLQSMCEDDDARLWGVSLCGPLIVVDPTTRQAWASEPDNTGALQPIGAGWVGALPDGTPVANAAVTWGGRDWIMVMAPLPDDTADRRVLVGHEAWHRIQGRLGLPMAPYDGRHLEAEEARTLLRLEFRALATALRSRGRARIRAAREALLFRAARHGAFPGAAAQEAALDRNEGLAAYTGVRLGAGDDAALYAAQTLDAYDSHDAYARAYAYASGPAYGLLLDRMQRNWRTELGPRAPANLLAERLRPRFGGVGDIEEARDRYGGQAIAAEESARAQAQRERVAALRAAFTQGPRLVLPLRAMQMEFDPNQVTPVDGLGSVYGVLTVRDVWGEFRTSSPALISQTFTELTAAQPDPTGLAGTGWRVSLASGYRVTAPGLDGVRHVERVPETDQTPD